MTTQSGETPEKTGDRKIIADLREILGQIRAWTENKAGILPARPRDSIDDELLIACEGVAEGLRAAVAPDSAANNWESASLDLKLQIPLQSAMKHLRDAHFRVSYAVVAQIQEDSCATREEIGHDILQKHFPQYDELFSLLAKSARMIPDANFSAEKREKFRVWADQNRQNLFALRWKMQTCESAARSAQSRARRNFRLAALACVLAGISALAALLFA